MLGLDFDTTDNLQGVHGAVHMMIHDGRDFQASVQVGIDVKRMSAFVR